MFSDETLKEERGECPRHILGRPTLEGLADYIKSHDIRKILCLVGAGASVAAGIPDFRSPDTGIYAQLGKYNFSDPTEVFSIALFRENPSIFYSIATEMNLWPDSHRPTTVHRFIKLLADESRLLRCCTQNIDGLERVAGVPEELLVEAHGSFRTASCIDCHRSYDIQKNRQEAAEGIISRCAFCDGLVKPDVVFFGEHLPNRFFDVFSHDTKEADLVIIIGTSLKVRPFALLPLHVRSDVPRVLFNKEKVGGRMFCFLDEVKDADEAVKQDSQGRGGTPSAPTPWGLSTNGTHFDGALDNGAVFNSLDGREKEAGENISMCSSLYTASTSSSEGFIADYEHPLHKPEVYRDLFLEGDCQTSIMRLGEYLGWAERLRSAL